MTEISFSNISYLSSSKSRQKRQFLLTHYSNYCNFESYRHLVYPALLSDVDFPMKFDSFLYENKSGFVKLMEIFKNFNDVSLITIKLMINYIMESFIGNKEIIEARLLAYLELSQNEKEYDIIRIYIDNLIESLFEGILDDSQLLCFLDCFFLFGEQTIFEFLSLFLKKDSIKNENFEEFLKFELNENFNEIIKKVFYSLSKEVKLLEENSEENNEKKIIVQQQETKSNIEKSLNKAKSSCTITSGNKMVIQSRKKAVLEIETTLKKIGFIVNREKIEGFVDTLGLKILENKKNNFLNLNSNLKTPQKDKKINYLEKSPMSNLKRKENNEAKLDFKLKNLENKAMEILEICRECKEIEGKNKIIGNRGILTENKLLNLTNNQSQNSITDGTNGKIRRTRELRKKAIFK